MPFPRLLCYNIGMKFHEDKLGQKALEDILSSDAYGEEESALLSSYLDECFDAIDEKRMKKIRKELALTPEDAFSHAILEVLDIDPDDAELKKLYDNGFLSDVKALDEKAFLANPYLRKIRFPKGKRGPWTFSGNYFAPYEGFLYDQSDAEKDFPYRLKDHVGFFQKEVSYPVVLEDGQVWMSVTPYEIHTMAEPIEKAHGRVLALGLGLAYYPFMVLRKKDVESVTIVEKDERVLSFFESHILPQFERREDVRLVHADALQFLADAKQGEYDTLFLDIHHNEQDGVLPYKAFLEAKERLAGTDCSFWIEKSILVYLRRILAELVREEKDGAYEKAKSDAFVDTLLDCFHDQLAEKTIITEEDVHALFSDTTLQELLQQA